MTYIVEPICVDDTIDKLLSLCEQEDEKKREIITLAFEQGRIYVELKRLYSDGFFYQDVFYGPGGQNWSDLLGLLNLSQRVVSLRIKLWEKLHNYRSRIEMSAQDANITLTGLYKLTGVEFVDDALDFVDNTKRLTAKEGNFLLAIDALPEEKQSVVFGLANLSTLDYELLQAWLNVMDVDMPKVQLAIESGNFDGIPVGELTAQSLNQYASKYCYLESIRDELSSLTDLSRQRVVSLVNLYGPLQLNTIPLWGYYLQDDENFSDVINSGAVFVDLVGGQGTTVPVEEVNVVTLDLLINTGVYEKKMEAYVKGVTTRSQRGWREGPRKKFSSREDLDVFLSGWMIPDDIEELEVIINYRYANEGMTGES